MKNIYLLKDLAVVAEYSTPTLKYYLRIGLLREIGRSPVTNFRYFDDESVKHLKDIRSMRNKGFSLKDINERITNK